MATVSVIIPTYNRGSNIERTLDSVLAQTLAPSEILVVDDGSTDGTADWIEAHYGEKVRVIRQQNQGVAAARNRGLKEAKGEYVAFLDHDDIWLPQKLEKQLEVALAHPQVALVSCLWDDVDENGDRWNDEIWQQIYRRWKPERGFVYDWICDSPCPIISMTLPLIHVGRLREVGGFDSDAVPCDDWDVYLKLAHRFPFEIVEEKLALYVHHRNQQSGDVAKLHAATLRVLQHQFLAVLSHPRSWSFWWFFSRFLVSSQTYYRAKGNLEKGKFGLVAIEFLKVGLRHPFSLGTKQWLYLLLRFLRRQTAPF